MPTGSQPMPTGPGMAPTPGPSTTFASPSAASAIPSSNYPPAMSAPPGASYPPGAIYRDMTPYSAPNGAGVSIGAPRIISPPSDAASSPAPTSRVVPPGPSPSPSPKTTFKNPAPSDAPANSSQPSSNGQTEPSTRWTDRFAVPGADTQNNGSSGADSNGANTDSGDSGSSGGNAVNPHETHFQQQRSSEGEDRMASRAQRQTTIYRPVASSPIATPATIVVLDDSVWRPAARP